MEPPDSLVKTNSPLLSAAPPSQATPQQKFLRCRLGSQDSALLPLFHVAEVRQIAVADMLPVPAMPDCVLGICNWRGKMLWLVDLNLFLDYPPLLAPEIATTTVMAIVMQIEGQSMGLVVSQVQDIEWYAPNQIQPATVGLFSAKTLPFLQGYLPDANAVVLAPEAIARCPMWQIHRG
jgi:chemotaxis signal transduction protein